MRIILKTTTNTLPVPFDYQAKMVGCLHKWIGTKNELHGKISLYSFSWLQDGVVVKSALSFPHGARFFISFYDESVVKDIIRTILDDPAMFCGMEIRDITLAPAPDFSKRNLYYCGSPILIKRKMEDGSFKQFNFNDAEASQYMKETLVNKMHEAGLEDDETLAIHFDTSYEKTEAHTLSRHRQQSQPLPRHHPRQTGNQAFRVGSGYWQLYRHRLRCHLLILKENSVCI